MLLQILDVVLLPVVVGVIGCLLVVKRSEQPHPREENDKIVEVKCHGILRRVN